MYCGATCQKRHWREGGHRQACEEPPSCTICLEGTTRCPMQCGCACRGEAGLAHVACKAAVAAHRGTGWNEAWEECQTCGQDYTGGMQLGLETLAATPTDEQESENTRAGKGNLANALSDMGEHAEALLRGVLATNERLHGPADARTLTTTAMLGNELQDQGEHAEAVVLYRPTLAARWRVLGPEHPQTLRTTNALAVSLGKLGQHAEVEPLCRSKLEVQRRAPGLEHRKTLRTTQELVFTLNALGKHAEAEAEALHRETLAAPIAHANCPDSRWFPGFAAWPWRGVM